MAVWSTAYVDSLPNSSFAWVDKDGNRHLPYKDKDGNIDHSHTANALARLNQVQGMSDSERASVKAKLEAALGKTKASISDERISLSISSIKLDANGELPTRIPLFVTGNWPNSVKGKFSVDLNDLKQIKANFDKGIGFPTDDASTGLAIDFKHEYQDMAGAWIKGLELDANEETGQGTLYADPVEWTDEGEAAVKGGRFKCISPMGYFGRREGKFSLWSNPTNLKQQIANVLEGAGLTNIPFLRGMAPIRASAEVEDDPDYVVISKNKESKMNLDALRVKDKDQLTAEEVTFLTEHRSEMSADELKKFGLEADKPTPADTLSTEDRDLLDAIHTGKKKVVDATVLSRLDKLDALEATAEEYKQEKAKQIVLSHIKRGAVKPVEEENTVKMLLSLEGDARKSFESHLNALPSNELLSEEYGHKDDVVVTDVVEELDKKAAEIVEKAKTEGRAITYGQAQREALSRDNDLNARYEEYRKQQQ